MHFYKGLSRLLIFNVLIKPIWIFGIDRVVQNRVGHEAYGSYFSVLGLCITLGFVADAGLTNMLNRELSVGKAVNIRQLIIIKLICSLLYVAAACTILVLTQTQQWQVILPVLIIQLASSYLLFFRAVITAHQLFHTDAWLSIVDKGVMILLCGWALYFSFSTITLIQFLWLQVVSVSIALLFSMLIVVKKTNVHTSTKMAWKNIAVQTFPFFILLLLMSAHNRLDAFLLQQLHIDGTYQAGIYASAFRLLDAGNVAGYLVASFLVPFAGRHLYNMTLLSNVSIALRQALLLLSAIAITFTIVYASIIQQLLYPSLPPHNPAVLVWCIVVLPAYFITHIYGSLLTAKGALKTFSFIVLFSLAMNIMLNLLLIPKGAIGTCQAALISQSICAISCMAAAQKTCGVLIKPFLLATSMMAGFLYWLLFFAALKYELPLWLLASIVAGLTALLMFAAWRRIPKELLHN